MTAHKIHIEDLIEVNISIENSRPVGQWTADRLYGVINLLKVGDTIEVLKGIDGDEHYARRTPELLRYWASPLGELDDFGVPYGDEMFDGKTLGGPWANMSTSSWVLDGIGRLGPGFGQRYKKQPDGRWLKVEG